nr:hypothetical protein [Chloroflexota bacterium]
MNSRSILACLLAILVLMSACSPLVMPTPTPVPIPPAMPSPTVPATTTAAKPVLTPSVCPLGYALYSDHVMGFFACYPDGWLIAKKEDPDAQLIMVSFNAPAGTKDAGLRFISVSTSPAITDYSDEDFLREITHWLTQEYYEQFLIYPQTVLIDDRKAVEAVYSARVVLGREVVEVTRWISAFQSYGQRWFIEVAGRAEYRNELEQIHAQFLAHLRVFPP